MSAWPQFINFRLIFYRDKEYVFKTGDTYYHRYYCCDSDSTLSYYL